jgi:hypothetical protein
VHPILVDVARNDGVLCRDTKTKPLKDVDIFFVLGQNQHWRKKLRSSCSRPGACLTKEYGAESVDLGVDVSPLSSTKETRPPPRKARSEHRYRASHRLSDC